MNKKDLKVAWLASNAVVAFVGALLVGQSWQQTDRTAESFFNLTIPDYSGLVHAAFITFLLVLSLVFALGSIIRQLRSWALSQGIWVSMPLGFLAWFAFILSWLSALPELPDDQWWTPVLIWGGIVMVFLFIPFHVIVRPINIPIFSQCVQYLKHRRCKASNPGNDNTGLGPGNV